LQALFQLDVQGPGFLDELDGFLADQEQPEPVVTRARELVHGTWVQRGRYDRLIRQVSEHWDLDRMAPVDRNIIRLALYELLDCEDPPPKVAIDEAIELAKEFGSAESPGFVNGVLDAIWRRHREPPVQPQEQRES